MVIVGRSVLHWCHHLSHPPPSPSYARITSHTSTPPHPPHPPHPTHLSSYQVLSIDHPHLAAVSVMSDSEDEVNIAQFHPLPGTAVDHQPSYQKCLSAQILSVTFLSVYQLRVFYELIVRVRFFNHVVFLVTIAWTTLHLASCMCTSSFLFFFRFVCRRGHRIRHQEGQGENLSQGQLRTEAGGVTGAV